MEASEKRSLLKYVPQVRHDPDKKDPCAPHLGGGRARGHVDIGAFEYILKKFEPKKMLDVGCGMGLMCEVAKARGVDAIGIDGDPYGNPDILWDFTKGFHMDLPDVDLVWSCEFVEHVEEKYMPNYMNAFIRGPVVVLTYAPPGKRGHHHVNCQEEGYWIEAMSDYGFEYDPVSTRDLRAHSHMESLNHRGRLSIGKRFIPDHGLVFLRRD